LPDLFFEAARGAGDELVGAFVEQEHGGRVAVEDVEHSVEELDQQVVDVEVPEGGVGEALEVTQAILGKRCLLRLRQRPALVQQMRLFLADDPALNVPPSRTGRRYTARPIAP
jgi:hypothetical protein